ncbi:MAG: hypothetical protein NE330_06300, partial [Lentisphaeraceae bacterium]|nr:hypothetical protein [Lentisphaeraceae bacterium]
DNIHKWDRATTYNIDLRGGFWWGANSPTRYGKLISDQSLWPGPAYSSGTPAYKLGAFIAKVMQPSEFLMFADADASNDFLHPNFNNAGAFSSSLGYAEDGTEKRGTIAFRHSGKSTTVFTDGHAKFLTPKYENYKKSKVYLDSQL